MKTLPRDFLRRGLLPLETLSIVQLMKFTNSILLGSCVCLVKQSHPIIARIYMLKFGPVYTLTYLDSLQLGNGTET